MFRQDLDSVVFGEFSSLTIGEGKTVLQPPDRIVETISNQNARYAVIRPLFESDRAVELLDLFPKSVGIWLFRDCREVVSSMVRKWGDRFFEISRGVENDQYGHWRLEKTVASILTATAGAPIEEAYAHYWLARNKLAITNGWIDDPRMHFISYSGLISDPAGCVDRVMSRAGFSGVWKGFRAEIRSSHFRDNEGERVPSDILLDCSLVYKTLLTYSPNEEGD
jgi:hypothetical protein